MVRATVCHCPRPTRAVQVQYCTGRPVPYVYNIARLAGRPVWYGTVWRRRTRTIRVQYALSRPVPHRYNNSFGRRWVACVDWAICQVGWPVLYGKCH